ncbi:hypothetical protein T484DRAFT_1833154 [Baffinella frigidus]|nr:hypothetical protein T484DRAFT_1833154 [Cryptophyta sp. CCMP2293]
MPGWVAGRRCYVGGRCYVGAATRLATLERRCECEEADYECDFCYERIAEGS